MNAPLLPGRIEHWPLARLRPYARNAKTHDADQVAKIAASMAEFGWTVPCLVAADGELIAGHGRILAAERLGLAEAPVIVLGHLTEAQRRAYRIADNKLTELGGWDEALLLEELRGLMAEDFDLGLIGIKDAVTADGEVVVPIDVEAFGFWLKAAFGAPTTTGTTPKTHTFQSGNWTLPSMAIEVAMSEVPRFAMYAGCVMDQLSWQMNRSGLLTATARLIAQGETIAATTAAGTPTALGLQRFGHFNGVVKRNGTALGNVVSAEITYANGLDRIETIRNDGKIEGADPGMAALTGRIEVRFADSALVTQAIDGTPCELEFAYNLGANASFTFTAHAVYLPVPRIEIPGPQGIQATFDWQAAKAISPARMCTAVLVNTVTGY